MSVKIVLDSPGQTMESLGLRPGGDVHRFIMQRVKERMEPYLPYREGGSFVIAENEGFEPENARIVIDLRYAERLYFGLAPSGRDINYAKRPHPKAGPYWEKRMMADQSEVLYREINNYIRSR